MLIFRTLTVSYILQIYTAILTIIFLPLYLKYIGTESYGVFALSIMLQGITQLFDMGLAQTLMRETSRLHVNLKLKNDAYNIFLLGEKYFFILNILLIIFFLIASSWFAQIWLRIEELPYDVVNISIFTAFILAGLRWYINFYRSGLLGYGLHKWINLASAFFASLRYIGSIPLLAFANMNIAELLAYHLLISLLELITYRWRIKKIIIPTCKEYSNSLELIKNHYKILGSLAIASWLWTITTQLDKFFLSHWLTLSDYALFSLAVTAAGIISLIVAPIWQLLQPRFNVLAANNEREKLLALYRTSTKNLTVILIGVASIIAFFAEPILTLWTGNALHAEQAAPILFWYILGNASAALLMLPFMLQYALGHLRLHVIGNVIFSMLWLPALVFAAYYAGGVGTGIAWFIGNTLFLLIWTSYTHISLFPELSKTWLIRNAFYFPLPIIISSYIFATIVKSYF